MILQRFAWTVVILIPWGGGVECICLLLLRQVVWGDVWAVALLVKGSIACASVMQETPSNSVQCLSYGNTPHAVYSMYIPPVPLIWHDQLNNVQHRQGDTIHIGFAAQ